MQLAPGERSILAYFSGSNSAVDAARALKNAGFSDIQVDKISRFGDVENSEYNHPIAGRAVSQTGLSLFSAETPSVSDDDSRVLLGADPSVEGNSPSNYDPESFRNFLVTVVTSDSKVEEATVILRSKGAYF